MSTRDTHDRWDELAAGYALDALEPDEELAFTEHLAGCDICARQLDEHSFVAAQLGSLAGDAEVRPPAWSTLRIGVVGHDRPSPVLPLQRRRPAALPRLLAAAAAVIVLAGIGVLSWQATQPTTTAATRAIADCRHHTGCSVVRLHTPTGVHAAVVLVSDDRATLVPLAMKPAAASRTYVVWQLPRAGSPTPVTTFAATGSDTTAPLVMSYADTAAFAVSLEPAGTPPSQPTDVLAVGNATA